MTITAWINARIKIAQQASDIAELKADIKELKELLKENRNKDEEHEKEVLRELKRLEHKSDLQDRQIHARVSDLAQAFIAIETKVNNK